jgi:hypothetical protein
MSPQLQFLDAIAEALQMAIRTINNNTSKEEKDLTSAVLQFRLGQIKRDIAREQSALRDTPR